MLADPDWLRLPGESEKLPWWKHALGAILVISFFAYLFLLPLVRR